MIDKIKEKKPGKKGLKERVPSAPKQLLHRGLDDGTERLRGQFRDASQRGQRDDYGVDRIEDTAWTGTRWAGRGIEKLLKKKWGGRYQGPEAEPVPASDSPEMELPLEGPVATDPPRQGGAEERVRIKTREATAQRAEGPKGFPGEGPPLPVSLVLPLKNPPMCAQNHRRSKRGSISNRVFFRMGMWFYLPRSLLLLKGPPVPESRRSARFFAAGSLLPPVCAKRPLFHSQGHHKCLL